MILLLQYLSNVSKKVHPYELKDFSMRILPLLCFAVLSPLAFAANLSAPIDMEGTAVLPKGIRNIRLKGVGTDIEQKYNNRGSVVGLGDDMNSPLTLQRAYDGNSDDQKASDTKALAQNNGLADSDSLGTTTGAVTAAASITVPVFAYGVSDKWTTAFALPIVRVQSKVATGFVADSSLRELRQYLIDQGRDDLLVEFDNKTQNPILYKVQEYNYDPMTNSEATKLGDLKWVNKLRVYDNHGLSVALKGEMVIPTGEEKNINKVVDVPSGDGQWDLGAGVNLEYQMGDLTWANAVSYTWQTPYRLGVGGELQDQLEVRVPRFEYSSLSPDKEIVKRDLGDQIFAQTGLKLDFFHGFSVLTAYSFQYKERDTYKGAMYSEGRYELLGKNSRQRMQSVTLGGGYSTIPLFKEKKFAVPLQANVTWARPIEGKNVNKDAVAQGELVLFF